MDPRPGLEVLIGAPIASVAAGARHSVAVTTGGEVYTWGDNGWGQLGRGSPNAKKEERGLLTANDMSRVKNGASRSHTPGRVNVMIKGGSVIACEDHSFAIGVDGSAYAWGDNTAGVLGTGSAAPMSVDPVRMTYGGTGKLVEILSLIHISEPTRPY